MQQQRRTVLLLDATLVDRQLVASTVIQARAFTLLRVPLLTLVLRELIIATKDQPQLAVFVSRDISFMTENVTKASGDY